MKYQLIPTRYFVQQMTDLDEKEKRIIESKLDLIRLNPFRFKKIHSKLHSRVFRVRLNINNQDSRLIYVVIDPKVVLVCILARKDDYRDLETHLKDLER